MDKDKPPLSSSRYASASTSVAPDSSDAAHFSHDISRMPDFPPRNPGHRRAQSEILSLPDDITFDSDLGVVGAGGDGPSLSDETEEDFFSMYIDMDKFAASSSGTSGAELLGNEILGAGTPALQMGQNAMENLGSSSGDRPRIRHQHSQSMDGSTSIKPEMLVSGPEGASLADAKKAMSAAKLADLALVDPKRAKRIWANRQSAARSKERKMRYIAELERKVQTLQTEATTLSAQLTMLQRDTNGLTAENNELKLRLQNMEQQVHLQDALNDALREEVQRLKLATGQMLPNVSMMNFGPSSFGVNQQFYPHNQAMQSLLAAHQLQQLQLHPQHQQQLHPHQHQQQHQHQHQQQQTPAHQHQQQQQQQPAETRMKGTLSPPNQRESASDNSNIPNE